VTIADLVQEDIEHLDEKLLNSYMIDFDHKVKVLAAPFRPEQAEAITGKNLTAILQAMRANFDYIVVDTAPVFTDTMLAVLDASDKILIISVTDLPTIKNVKICLEVMENLGYGKEKIKLILNRAQSESGLDLNEVEESLRYKFSATVPSDGKTVVASVNRGIPFVISNPDTQVARSIYGLIRSVTAQNRDDAEEEPSGTLIHKIKRLFG
jgi:pilus assembly protein CpaE